MPKWWQPKGHRHISRWSTSLLIKEIQIKMTVGHYYVLNRVSKVEVKGEYEVYMRVWTGTISFSVGESPHKQHHLISHLAVSHETENPYTLWLRHSIPIYIYSAETCRHVYQNTEQNVHTLFVITRSIIHLC